MSKRRIIFLEFNELCPSLLERWMSEGKLPNFKRFYQQSDVYITESDEKNPAYLEPWIQWYSMHTGLSYQQHGVFHLTDGPKSNHPDIWRALLENGKTVGNCSSMNAKGFEAPGSFFLPDPWCTTERPYPAELGDFHAVVARAVQQYSNSQEPLSGRDYFRFLKFMVTHGLRLKTAMAIARQLVLDRVVDKQETWRRAVLLDKLQFDVFRHYFQALKPDFSTFFLNSTAHFQHSYWRHMEPEAFSMKPSGAELKRYGGAILLGYQTMDELLGDFFEFESDDTMLILATALSQQPFLKREGSGGQHFYRPSDMESLLGSCGIRAVKLLPVMSHQFLIEFAGEGEAEQAKQRLQMIRYQGREVFDFAPSHAGSLYVGCQISSALPSDALITMGNGKQAPFFDVFYALGAMKSGCHHPDGALWIKSGHHHLHGEKLSILDVLPMTLSHYGLVDQAAWRQQGLPAVKGT